MQNTTKCAQFQDAFSFSFHFFAIEPVLPWPPSTWDTQQPGFDMCGVARNQQSRQLAKVLYGLNRIMITQVSVGNHWISLGHAIKVLAKWTAAKKNLSCIMVNNHHWVISSCTAHTHTRARTVSSFLSVLALGPTVILRVYSCLDQGPETGRLQHNNI